MEAEAGRFRDFTAARSGRPAKVKRLCQEAAAESDDSKARHHGRAFRFDREGSRSLSREHPEESKMTSLQFAKLAKRTALVAVTAGLLALEAGGSAFAANYAYMNCSQLWYARNSIYAQEGYCFQTAAGQAAFPNSCFPPYGKLTKWEQNQVSQIKYWERQKGCS
jgi:YARHG domain